LSTATNIRRSLDSSERRQGLQNLASIKLVSVCARRSRIFAGYMGSGPCTLQLVPTTNWSHYHRIAKAQFVASPRSVHLNKVSVKQPRARAQKYQDFQHLTTSGFPRSARVGTALQE
jgi:hypothetical protein